MPRGPENACATESPSRSRASLMLCYHTQGAQRPDQSWNRFLVSPSTQYIYGSQQHNLTSTRAQHSQASTLVTDLVTTRLSHYYPPQMDHFPPLNQVGGVFTRQEQPHINSHMAIDPRRSSSDISMGSLRRDSLNIIRDDEDNVSTLSTASETTHVGQTTTNNPTRHSNPSQIPAYQPVHNDMTGTGPDETVPLASIHREAKSFTKTKEPKKSPVSWWWWWEIGAAFLSLVCVGLILAVLLKANNLALADWPLWIQPNSLLAVFTTVGKSALMVPVASCISQLKWRHFQVRANRLSHLQILDDASRGPWGSLMVLLNVRVRAFTVWALAIVSLIALGFDPSAQQILDFPVRDTRLTNISAEIGTAVEYSSIAYLEDKDGSSGRE